MKELTSTNVSTTKSAPNNKSQEPKIAPKDAVGPPANSFTKEMAKQKENDIENAVSDVLGGVNETLEQDRMEGVDENEWVGL